MYASIEVRELKRSDLERVLEIDRALSGAGRFPTWPFSFGVYWREYRPDISLVAEVDGVVAGFIVGCMALEEHGRSILNLGGQGRPRPISHVGWIDMIGVDPGHQQAGLGRRMVQEFCSRCNSANVAARAVVREDDARLRHFLESVGFKARDYILYEKAAPRAGGQ